MNFKLTRKNSSLYGITGQLSSEDNAHTFVTLEHAYSDGKGGFCPKLAPGLYTCVWHEPHRLHYPTYMVTGVPPFQGAPVDGILIHVGNYNQDSEGCILVGLQLGTGCILESQKAFDQFMEIQNRAASFTLMVE